MLRHALSVFFVFFCTYLQSQKDFSKPDSVAFEISNRNYTSIFKLTKALTKNFTSDLDKFRAIFRWITINIKYEIGSKISSPSEVLRSKKTVCKGYANLLKAMCDAEGLECVYVSGWVKGQIDDINWSFKSEQRHAWNAVKIDGKWVLTDVTWASSYQRKDTIFHEFDENYFLMDPGLFSLQHFPVDKKWLFTDLKKIEFKRQPVYYPFYFDYSDSIFVNTPISGHEFEKEIEISIIKSICDSTNDFVFEIYGDYDTVLQASKVNDFDKTRSYYFDFSFVKKKTKAVLKLKNKFLIGFYAH